MLYVPFSTLTLSVGWQEGHPACKNHFTNPQRFSCRTDAEGGIEEESVNPGSTGKTAVKWKYSSADSKNMVS